jgi:signal recognition particle subunit SRP72
MYFQYYRLEDFVEASKICDSLANSKCEGPNEDGDLRVNITATNAQLHWSGQSAFVSELTTSNGDLDVFEETFNMACVSIARGDDVRGAMFLRRASGMCFFLLP